MGARGSESLSVCHVLDLKSKIRKRLEFVKIKGTPWSLILRKPLKWLALFTAKAVVTKGLKKWDRSSCD
jgi:hypothetical protein